MIKKALTIFEKVLIPMSKIFIKNSKARKICMYKSHKWNLYDTRTFEEFRLKSYPNVEHVTRFLIKYRILKHRYRDSIIIFGNHDKSTLGYVRWARRKGYKNIFASSYAEKVELPKTKKK